MRRKRAKSEYVKQLEQHRERCNERHPNWHGVRCERQDNDHYVHTGEDRNYEWVDRK